MTTGIEFLVHHEGVTVVWAAQESWYALFKNNSFFVTLICRFLICCNIPLVTSGEPFLAAPPLGPLLPLPLLGPLDPLPRAVRDWPDMETCRISMCQCLSGENEMMSPTLIKVDSGF